MKKSIIIIKKNSFIYNEEEYDFDKVDDILHLLKANLKIIVLEEDLYIKQFTNNIKKRKIYEFVNYKINNDFPQNGDILYDYKFKEKSNIICIYSIRGAKRVEKLSNAAKNIEIKPIQFIIKDLMSKLLKNDDFTCEVLIKFNECYYFISFKEGLFFHGFVEKDINFVFDKIIENTNLREIYVDSSITNYSHITNKIKIIKMNIGELINEKIYEKQRFHTRKILW